MITQQHGNRDRQRRGPAEHWITEEGRFIRTDHVQVTVREVEQLQHPVGHREAERHQRMSAPVVMPFTSS